MSRRRLSRTTLRHAAFVPRGGQRVRFAASTPCARGAVARGFHISGGPAAEELRANERARPARPRGRRHGCGAPPPCRDVQWSHPVGRTFFGDQYLPASPRASRTTLVWEVTPSKSAYGGAAALRYQSLVEMTVRGIEPRVRAWNTHSTSGVTAAAGRLVPGHGGPLTPNALARSRPAPRSAA